MDGYSFPGQNVETIVGNGRLIARVRAGSAEFVFAGPADGLTLSVDGAPLDGSTSTRTSGRGSRRTRCPTARR